jgi:hypothetical protein
VAVEAFWLARRSFERLAGFCAEDGLALLFKHRSSYCELYISGIAGSRCEASVDDDDVDDDTDADRTMRLYVGVDKLARARTTYALNIRRCQSLEGDLFGCRSTYCATALEKPVEQRCIRPDSCHNFVSGVFA